MTVSGGAVTAYQYDLNNRLLIEEKVSGETTEITRYTYDHNGNQIYKATETLNTDIGQQEEYGIYVLGEDIETETVAINQYNGLNQLVLTVLGDITAEYTYNADGLRRSKTVNNNTITHVWDGSNIVLELNNSGEIYAKYIRGINLIYSDTGTVSYYLFNAHGDVVQLTGNDGTLIKTYKYDAFGNEESPDSADNNPFRYCGEYFDKETNTIYLRARYYSPSIGRFITEDSYLGKDNDPLSLNLYTYCANNPIIYIDPSGNVYVIGWSYGKADLKGYTNDKGEVDWAKFTKENSFARAAYTKKQGLLYSGVLESEIDVQRIDNKDDMQKTWDMWAGYDKIDGMNLYSHGGSSGPIVAGGSGDFWDNANIFL